MQKNIRQILDIKNEMSESRLSLPLPVVTEQLFVVHCFCIQILAHKISAKKCCYS